MVLCNVNEKISCKKLGKSIHALLIYAYFSYTCTPKPVGRIIPSRLEMVKLANQVTKFTICLVRTSNPEVGGILVYPLHTKFGSETFFSFNVRESAKNSEVITDTMMSTLTCGSLNATTKNNFFLSQIFRLI